MRKEVRGLVMTGQWRRVGDHGRRRRGWRGDDEVMRVAVKEERKIVVEVDDDAGGDNDNPIHNPCLGSIY